MSTGGLQAITETGVNETMDLQQQVARLQALLEVSRQVHATTHETEVQIGRAHV